MEARISELSRALNTAEERLQSRENELKESVQALQGELDWERARASDLDARNARTAVKLDVVTKSLAALEAANHELSESHDREVSALRQSMQEMQLKRKAEKESAEAERRTVEAAMKAYATLEDKTDREVSCLQSGLRQERVQEEPVTRTLNTSLCA